MAIIGSDDRAIVNPFTVLDDTIADNDPILWTTAIDVHFANDIEGLGSGFAIAPNYILSAGHNAYNVKSPVFSSSLEHRDKFLYKAIRATLSTEEDDLSFRSFQRNPLLIEGEFGKGIVNIASDGTVIDTDPDANIADGNVNFLADYFPDATAPLIARDKDIALFKTNSNLLSAPEISIGIMAFVDPFDAIGYRVNSAGYPGDNVGNIPGSSAGSGRDLVFISGEIIGDPINDNFIYFSETFDTMAGQSGSGVWHTPKSGDLLEGDDSRVLGVLTGSFIPELSTSVETSGVLITADIYQTMMLAMKQDTQSLANELPENAIVGSSNINDNIIGTYRKERILGQEGNDILSGGGEEDRLEGGLGDDILSGGEDNDRLEGGAGDDFLDGGSNSNVGGVFGLFSKPGSDTAVFSDNLENYNVSFSGEDIIVSHNAGTDGTDTLRNIEIGEFNGKSTPLKKGSFNTTCAEAPTTSTNFFDPGIPVNLNLGLPVSTINGEAAYSLNVSQIKANPLYNIAFIIDTSASMNVNPIDFQNVKDAHTTLIENLKDSGIAENTNFGIVSFSKNATLYEDLTADEAISTIQNLTTAPAIEGTQYRNALDKGIDFFTQSPLSGKNVTNLAYFVSDGRSRSTYPEPTYHNNARFLRDVANVQAFGINNETNPASAVTDGQINFVDSEQGVIVADSSELELAMTTSGLVNDIEQIKILQDNSIVATLQPDELTDTAFGLNYEGSLDGLDIDLDAANEIRAEVSFIDDSSIASSGSVDFTIGSSLDDSGAEPLTTIAEGSGGDDEIILGSIDLGANADGGNDKLVGNNFGNILDGGAGDDSLYGHDGNDTLIGGAGDDLIDGGAGIDTVAYTDRVFASAVIEQKGSVTKIDDLDTLVNVEYLEFSDVRVDAETLEVVPTLEGTDISIVEGDSSTTTAQFTLNLDTSTSNSVEFEYTTVNLDAIAGEDYTATSGTITIPSGSTSATIDVEISGDTDYELDESFTLELSAINGATFIDNQEEYTLFANIENDDPEPTTDPVGSPQAFAETGTISLTNNTETIDLINNYSNPVVFAQPPSFNGGQPALVRLDNITDSSFDARIQEPNYLVDAGDGGHIAETISYFVFEAGTWQLEDGTILEVGTTEREGLVRYGAGFETVEFDFDFDSEPIVVSQVQTTNGGDFVRTRQRNTTVDGFEMAMEEEEANRNSSHYNESVGWLAIESGIGESEEFTFYADNTGDTVNHVWSTTEFDGLFSEVPQILAGMSSYDGADAAGIRYDNLSATGVDFKVEEETSFDEEISHTRETIDFLLMEGSGSLNATEIAPLPSGSIVGIEEGLTTELNNSFLETTEG